MTLVAVTCMSSGEQSWKDKAAFDVTVTLSLISEFSFIVHSEAGWTFSMLRVRSSASPTLTLHNTREEEHDKRCSLITTRTQVDKELQYVVSLI